jgi:hypothetical protein
VKIPKLPILVIALISVAVFLFHLGILCTSLLKLNTQIWSIYKYYGNALDLFFLSLYCLTFILSLAVWLFADTSLGNRAMYAGMLFPFYFVTSLAACISVCFLYSVAVGGY